MMHHITKFALLFGFASAPCLVHAELSASVMALAKRCAPSVSPITMAYVVSHESENNPFALNVNGGARQPQRPRNREEAIKAIHEVQEKGLNFDVGLGQVNSANFQKLGVTAESLLDGCNNLRASSVILSGCYAQAVKSHGEGQQALRHALSCYNTGNQKDGFTNGYVAKVVAQAEPIRVPALIRAEGDGDVLVKDLPAAEESVAAQPKPKRRLGTPDAFTRATGGAFESRNPDAFESAQENPGVSRNARVPDPAEAARGFR